MKISELFGKKIESTSGKSGYVISVNARGGKIECLICADADEKEFAVDVKNITGFDEKITFNDREHDITQARPLRLGCAGFDEHGKYLGNLEEYVFVGNKIKKAKIGKRLYPVESITFGDVIIVKDVRKLKEDVVKDGKVILRKGTPVTGETLAVAEKQGEYIQTSLKSL